MDVRGWVYIISNEAMPGLLKVGFSTKDPHLRAQELSSTGAPLPYTVLYDVLLRAPRDAEQSIHKHLKDKRAGKEWFRCTLHEAVAAVRTVSNGLVIAENMSKACESALSQAERSSAGTYQRAAVALRPKWVYSESSGRLTHKETGRIFTSNQYHYDGAGMTSGFSVRDPHLPWAPIDEVEFVE